MIDPVKIWEDKEKESQKERTYLHFDQKTSISKAKKFVTSPEQVTSHCFYPFIQNTLITPRFKKDKITGERKWEKKQREIMYASHSDTLIYSYYNILLGLNYEKRLAKEEFKDSVIAYRKLGRSNIDFAQEAFYKISNFGECVVLAFDVSDFFPGLDHQILKESWEFIMNFDDLRKARDHYNVYKSLTRFAYVEKRSLDSLFKVKEKRSEGKKIFRYCSGKEFREKVRANKLIKVNQEVKGIPQGSPISALLSNIYMYQFDRTVYDRVCKELNGIYRRYSDDILIVCKPDNAYELEEWIKKKINNDFKLVIQDKKTEKFSLENKDHKGILRPINLRTDKRQNVQYLGFEYDGDHIFIRSSSISRYYRRMKKHIHITVKKARLKGSEKVFKKKLLVRNSEQARSLLTEKQRRKFRGNFITYAQRAAFKTGDKKILNQIKHHRKKLKKAFEGKIKDSINKSQT